MFACIPKVGDFMRKKAKALFASSLLLGGLAFGITTGSFSVADAKPVYLAAGEADAREQNVRRELGTFAQLAKTLNPSVVNIAVTKRHSNSRDLGIRIPEEFRRSLPEGMFPDFPGSRQSKGQGSGVIISEDGEILTNNHVVEGASEIRVTLSDGRELEAKVLGRDSNTDLALLKVEDAKALPVAKLGDSDTLEVGDWVMAIGNPFGLEATVTVGVLSGKGRQIGAGPYDDFLQTDTSINPGNSGGPLFDLSGEVVGINTAIIRDGQGIGFSIPINLAKDVSAQLRESGRVERGFIGVGIQPLTPALKSALSIPQDASGALVASVLDDGPAKAAGVEISDIIVRVAGRDVGSDKELLREVAKLRVGESATLEVLRDGKRQTLRVEIAKRPNEEASDEGTAESTGDDSRLGVAVRDTQGDDGSTVIVAEVVPGSRAAEAGIRRGDRIRAIGNQQVKSAEEFIRLVEKAKGHDLALLVERGGRTSFVVIED
jgi:serine protease Do